MPVTMIAVFKADAIGDLVLALGAIRRITMHFGEPNVSLYVASACASLARAEFPRSRVVEVNIRFHGNLWTNLPSVLETRAAETRVYDLLVSLRHYRSLYYELLLAGIRARRLVACPNDAQAPSGFLSRLLYPRVRNASLPQPPAQPDDRCTELIAHAAVVSEVTGHPTSRDDVFPSFQSIRPSEGSNLLICPYSRQREKDYSDRALCEALHALGTTRPPVHLCGSADQKSQLDQLAALLGTRGIIADVVIPANLGEFVATVAQAGLVLTVDSAAAHIATALDKRACILFSRQAGYLFGPWTKSCRQSWIEPQSAKHRHRSEPMTEHDIAPSIVSDHLSRLIQHV